MRTFLIPKMLATSLTLALVLGAGAARAETREDMSFDGLMAMAMIDKNKDNMVSKKEFLDMMTKVWDDRAKKMKLSGDRMSAEDFKQVLMYLKAGG